MNHFEHFRSGNRICIMLSIKSYAMKLFVTFCLSILMIGCLVSEKNIKGTYKSNYGDTLKILDNYVFKAELKDPDTLELQQIKYSSGKWDLKKGKLYLTCATRDMGGYWGCVPLNAGPSHLSRPKDCNKGNGGSLTFNKLMLPGKMRMKKNYNRAKRGETVQR